VMGRTDKLFERHLQELKKCPVNTREPTNGGMHPAHFFEAIAGMGERAQNNGTIARTVRNRKRRK